MKIIERMGVSHVAPDNPTTKRIRPPLPKWLANRPRDHRGYPITYVTAIRSDGLPDFTELDGARRLECIRDELCGLCGDPLRYWRAVIGGPSVIRLRLTLDPPMHAECASFAATDRSAGCPFLLNTGAARYSKPAMSGTSERPSRMFLATTRSHQLEHDGSDVLARCAAFKNVWEIQHGRLLPLPENISWP